jgi:hypothetical protein
VLTHSQFSSYEPELFPGLIYRMVKPKIVLLIFVSGKVVLTGAKVNQSYLSNKIKDSYLCGHTLLYVKSCVFILLAFIENLKKLSMNE